MRRTVSALALLLTLPAGASEQPAAPPDCTAAEHHQFDFWIGDWEVHSGEQLSGHNRISADLNHCTLNEHWRGASGVEGKSINVYDREARRWRQFWVDGRGGVLRLAGELDDQGRMVMQSDQAGTTLDRITWEALPDGTVRQRWEQSSDGGTQWKEVFNGLYRRTGSGQR